MFTGERLAGRFDSCQQAKFNDLHAQCSPYYWDSAQPLESSETEEQVVLDLSRKESDCSGLLGSL